MAVEGRTAVAAEVRAEPHAGHPRATRGRDRADEVGDWRSVARRDVVLSLVAGTAATAFVAAEGASLPRALLTLPLVGVLVAVSLVDAQTRRIPNALTIPSALVATVLVPAAGVLGWSDALGGLVLASLLSGALYVAARGAFGMGDVKLSAFLGTTLGAGNVVAVLALASALGAVVAAIALARGARRGDTIAFGPYLAAAGIALWCLRG